MKRTISLALVAALMLGFATCAQPAGAQASVSIAPTVEQLGWMAYGAPVQTLEAMGCSDQAQAVEQAMQLADSVRLLGGLLGAGAAAAGGLNLLAFQIQIGPISFQAQAGAVMVGVGLAAVANYLRQRERTRTRSLVMQIAQLHLEGKPTCMSTVPSTQ